MAKEVTDTDLVWELIQDYYKATKQVPSQSYLCSVTSFKDHKMIEIFMSFQKRQMIKRSVDKRGWILLK